MHDAPNTKPAPINDRLVDKIARDADTDRRSVIRRLAGLPVKGRAGKRIDRALEAIGPPTQAPVSGASEDCRATPSVIKEAADVRS